MVDYFYKVRNYLDITYTDQDTDDKLMDICSRAESYLCRAAGRTIVFSKDMDDQSTLQLLFDCIRYIWSGGLDDFGKNYSDELFMLRANVHADSADGG
jgi:hypothetical protein